MRQDSKTGLNNRLFFDNQLATLLEDQEKWVRTVSWMMMIRLPEFDLLRDNWDEPPPKNTTSRSSTCCRTLLCYPGAPLARYHRSDFAVLPSSPYLKEADSIAGLLLKAVDALPPTRILTAMT